MPSKRKNNKIVINVSASVGDIKEVSALRNKEERLWNVADLHPHPRQSEFVSGMTDAQLNELVQDIKVNGLDQRLEITASGVVISGHQRLKAVRRLGWDQVPVIVRHDLQSEEEILFRLVEANLHRQQFSKLQLARMCKALCELEPKGTARRGQGELNERIGRLYKVSGKSVERMLKLLDLPIELQKAVDHKQLPEVQAIELMKLPSEKYEPVLQQLRDDHNVRRLVNKLLLGQREKPPLTPKKQKRQWRDWLGTAVALESLREAAVSFVRPEHEPKLLAAQRLVREALAALAKHRRQAG